jgi:hypothetical protein
MRPEEILAKKHFHKLMVGSVIASFVISGAVFYFTQSSLIGAGVAATLIISDYIALKMLMKD